MRRRRKHAVYIIIAAHYRLKLDYFFNTIYYYYYRLSKSSSLCFFVNRMNTTNKRKQTNERTNTCITTLVNHNRSTYYLSNHTDVCAYSRFVVNFFYSVATANIFCISYQYWFIWSKIVVSSLIDRYFIRKL